jgi:hypothetical protein
MMRPVPLVQPIFVRLTEVTVSFIAIVLRSVLLASRLNVKPIVRFGFDGCQGNQPERREPQEEICFHMIVFLN